jgi:hypothetical protein
MDIEELNPKNYNNLTDEEHDILTVAYNNTKKLTIKYDSAFFGNQNLIIINLIISFLLNMCIGYYAFLISSIILLYLTLIPPGLFTLLFFELFVYIYKKSHSHHHY